MARVLIVSPNFPPINAADMHRVRVSLPFFRDFGWEPHVLTVAPEAGCASDGLLELTVPSNIPVERVASFPSAVTRRIGIGDAALRALPFINSAGLRLIRERGIDLVYFSTTVFFSMPFGRWWLRQTSVPFVLDIQDPWLSDYYETHPEATPPRKYALSQRLHARLERWTMARVGGLLSVSPDYLTTLAERYPRLRNVPSLVLPFAASATDFQIVAQHPQNNQYFDRGDGLTHAAYVGRAGDDMRPALEILFAALARGRESFPSLFEPVRLHFIGTDYADASRARQTVTPVATATGVGEVVSEATGRAPYFTALQVLRDARFLVLIGSNDPSYNASKVYPYLMTGQPIVAVVHERSPLVAVLRQASQVSLVTFGENTASTTIEQLLSAWHRLLRNLPTATPAVAEAADFGAREMTRQQCELFDRVLQTSARAVA